MSSSIANLINLANKLPGPVRRKVLTFSAGHVGRIIRTTGIQINKISEEEVELYLPNSKKVRNHIGGIAAAIAILHAETASALVMMMNVSDDSVPVLKSVQMDFKKRISGSLKATAMLTEEQQEAIRSADKGELIVETHLVDDSGNEPVQGKFTWAWIPKRR